MSPSIQAAVIVCQTPAVATLCHAKLHTQATTTRHQHMGDLPAQPSPSAPNHANPNPTTTRSNWLDVHLFAYLYNNPTQPQRHKETTRAVCKPHSTKAQVRSRTAKRSVLLLLTLGISGTAKQSVANVQHSDTKSTHFCCALPHNQITQSLLCIQRHVRTAQHSTAEAVATAHKHRDHVRIMP